MPLALWYVGILLRGGLLARTVARRLPLMSLLLIVYLVQSAGIRWLLNDPKACDAFASMMEPWYCLARVAAYVEAFAWFAVTLPRFALIGSAAFFGCSALGAWLQWRTLAPGTHAGLFDVAAGLEIGTGAGVLVALILAWTFFETIGGMNESARWHCIVLALWSMLDAAGWWGISHGWEGDWLIAAASIACPLLWLWKVSQPPTWRSPEPVGTREDVIRLINEMKP